MARAPSSHLVRLFLAFGAIYFIWGSTFLAIRFAVATIPPLLMMSGRCLGAGVILYAGARLAGTPRPQLRQWVPAFISGGLLFLICHGTLAWAEQRVASGPAALMQAMIPLWMVLFDWMAGTGPRPRAFVILGLVVGFTGVALLVLPGRTGDTGIDPAIATIMMIGSASWVVGSLYSRGAGLPRSVPLATGMQLLAGGVLLLAAAGPFGDVRRLSMAAVSTRSVLSLGYLIVFGSVVALTAYNWLLRETTPARLSTYSYVNPAVAVFLGWLFAHEPVGLATLIPTAVIVAGVGITLSARTRRLPVVES